MTNSLKNLSAISEPWFQDLLRRRRERSSEGLPLRGTYHLTNHGDGSSTIERASVTTFEEACGELLDVCEDGMKEKADRLDTKGLQTHLMQQNFWSPEQ